MLAGEGHPLGGALREAGGPVVEVWTASAPLPDFLGPAIPAEGRFGSPALFRLCSLAAKLNLSEMGVSRVTP